MVRSNPQCHGFAWSVSDASSALHEPFAPDHEQGEDGSQNILLAPIAQFWLAEGVSILKKV